MINSKHNIDIAILETTGAFKVIDVQKETNNYIKAGYGMVSMLHYTGRKYYYDDFEIFKRVNMYFIQVTRMQ
jgi:hypothetical protein